MLSGILVPLATHFVPIVLPNTFVFGSSIGQNVYTDVMHNHQPTWAPVASEHTLVLSPDSDMIWGVTL
jgi:hypothetical protein